ncbi:zinc finger protein 862-like isoform X2 [Mytilus edulis]|uniref:zinc finger protein 862-like isoform X2 n=1 Tax=Mytilus edulis TaxID=6550 RepID=UPI0039EF5BAB
MKLTLLIGFKRCMLCKFCIKFNMRPKNGSGTWVTHPCTYLVKDSVTSHSKSKNHQQATDLEAASIVASQGHGIQAALDTHTSMETTALIGAFRCMYWLAKEEIAHTTHYPSLLELAKTLGCDYLNLLKKGQNVNYTSQRTMQDMLLTINDQIQTSILQTIHNSPYFSLLIDETTDVAVVKQMTVMARYLTHDYQVKTSFLTLVDLPDGKADTIVPAIKTLMTDRQLPIQKMMGFGSDGASVMVGRKTGVATQLKSQNPEMVNVHCIAHRLALAAAQASDNIPYLQKFKDILRQLFYYYQNSAVRMSGLKEIELILGTPSIKLKEVADTRWLSHESAVTAIRRCLPALILSLEREASERCDATAAGLALFVKNPLFICTISMLSDILPHLNRLSKIFQKTTVDLSLIDSMVSATQMSLQHLLNQHGEHMTNLPDLFQQLAEYGVKEDSTVVDKFKDKTYQQYINNVIENLHNRFPDTALLDAFSVFDPDLICKEDPATNEYIHFKKLQTLASHFTSVGDYQTASEEFTSLRHMMARDMKDINYSEAIRKIATLKDCYPTLAQYAQILLVIPVSTADCERSFSTLNRLKTFLRNRLCQKILNPLMTISIEGPAVQDFNFPECVKLFGKAKNRKLTTE